MQHDDVELLADAIGDLAGSMPEILTNYDSEIAGAVAGIHRVAAGLESVAYQIGRIADAINESDD